MQDSRCEGLDYRFRIVMTSSFNNSNSADVICRSYCSASFPILSNTQFTSVVVWAMNRQGELVGTPSSTVSSKLGKSKKVTYIHLNCISS